MIIDKILIRRRKDVNNVLNKNIIKIELGSIIVIICIIIYTIVFSAHSISKHWTFNSFAWDLGIFNQGFWTTVNREGIFYNTCELHLVERGSFFGVHFSPILFLLAPIYRIFPSPETLLILQSLILGVAAYPLYLIGRRIVDRKTGLLVSTMYLCNPVVHGINCYDFHVQCMIPLSIFSSIYFYISKKWVSFLMSIVMALMIEEHIAYVIPIFSLTFIIDYLKNGEKKPAIPQFETIIPFFTVIFSVFWFFLSRNIINHFNPSISETLRAGRHFDIFGVDDPQRIPIHLVTKPIKIVDSLRYAPLEKLKYLMFLIGSNLHLPFLNPLLLLPAVPWFTISLLSNYQPYYSIGFQYPSYVLPFILHSFVVGLRNTRSNDNSRGHSLSYNQTAVLCLTASLIFFYIASPLSPSQLINEYSPAYLKPNSDIHSALIRRQLGKIPQHASVLTQDNIFTHLSSRSNAYVLPPSFGMDESEWNSSMRFILDHQPDYILLDAATDHHGVTDFAFGWMEENDYALNEISDEIFLFRRSSLVIESSSGFDLISSHPICAQFEGVDLL
uniref:DUF2079 domain membrane protein n=1 Tax=uncultured marine crenarchaeote E6-3G TaxID=907719 RepID=G9BAK7_9ARCH|nr:DUF2079 domain membrane protein [uncultured marine crenarchaeote E6-3G]